ncbi:MAG: L-histidine N(alpha)-methyltransferase [Hydrogenophaga sp.]|jgi:dimethylhistidine N-methyltransferase|uniref:L-histidine N(alpha)-methyltransferase n=1 Tax=Hydrogenophaga sp. TaxID=1904254 RepID=UPI00271844FB|nr:L-histidine N(alpha)-methyltransferase [Hydrogenophaga sp.]MDO9251038.1 L-histidine N(alpha)-methyltransferase [Hydrogenophaga sp.]MDP2404855.1 L-histidine N(alpha)-methyltransferase [Hydrogenophaga sp.]MDP3323016.1 L-histidine N(alpha)-methyltransferase [Hydrogenophaga sp.]MDZ4177608.1 L-histidine N(alpha)-methyltransferase [Hydrogenophaga sp.]
MSTDTPIPHFVQIHREDLAAVQAELAAGLRQTPPHVSPKFFYDALGSRLFDAITELAEYYPTRTEAAIFREHGAAMAQQVPAGAVLVDLGAGSCAKAAGLFPVLRPGAYVAVDISVDYLRETMGELRQRHLAIPMLGLGMDFSAELALPPAATDWLARHDLSTAPRCVFYPGSSIGNFNPTEALALLRQAHAVCDAGGPGGGILIGVDRVKDKAILEPAYDDPLGVTAAFNRNLLLHTNALLGTDFAPARWQHVAFFNEADSRIEMHLQSDGAQTVRWPGGERRFADGERLHTENSCKWHPADFDALLREAGFGPSTHWSDARGWFSVFFAPA